MMNRNRPTPSSTMCRIAHVNSKRMQLSLNRHRPFGDEGWVEADGAETPSGAHVAVRGPAADGGTARQKITSCGQLLSPDSGVCYAPSGGRIMMDMAETRHKRKPGFVKSFMQAKRNAHAGGANTFGSNLPPTAGWTCLDCGRPNPMRRETCDCGSKKPANPLAAKPS
jgi:hypothetical protein